MIGSVYIDICELSRVVGFFSASNEVGRESRIIKFFFFFSSRRRHTSYWRDWSSDVCSSDLKPNMMMMMMIEQMQPVIVVELDFCPVV